MAESTLTLKYGDFLDAVGLQAGFKRDRSLWTDQQLAIASELVHSGYRQTEYPPILPGETASHTWSHLTPTRSITITPAVSDTLAAIPTRTAGEYIFESATGVFVESMVGSEIIMTASGNRFEVTEFISATRVRVEGTGTVAFDVIVQSALVESFAVAVAANTNIVSTNIDSGTGLPIDGFTVDMVGDNIVFGSNSYPIIEFVSASEVVVKGDAESETGTFTVERTFTLLSLIYSAFADQGFVQSTAQSFRSDMTILPNPDTLFFPVSTNEYTIVDVGISLQMVTVSSAGATFVADNEDDTTAVVKRELTASSTTFNGRATLLFTDSVFNLAMIGQLLRFDSTGTAFTIENVTADSGSTLGHVVTITGLGTAEGGDTAKVVQAIGTVTGALAYAAPSTTLTITAANFLATMEGMTLTFETSGKSYTIGSFVSTTQITILGDAGDEEPADNVYVTGATDLDSGDAFTVSNTGVDYELPDELDAVEGEFTFDPDVGGAAVPQVGEGRIRRLRMSSSSGRPQKVAIRPRRVIQQEVESTRYELMVWPTPDATYTLTYTYRAVPQRMTDTKPYPLGGMRHGETIKASCLAVTELELNDEKGEFWATYQERLKAEIFQDREAIVPDRLGPMRLIGRRRIDGRADFRRTIVTVDGVTPT